MLYSIVSYLRESISSIYFLLKRLFLETSLLWSKLPVILTRCTDIFLGWTFTITLWILFTFFFLGILCSQVNFEVFSTLFCEPSCSFLMDESSNFKQWGTFSENLHVWKCYLLPSYCIMAVYSISWIYFLIFLNDHVLKHDNMRWCGSLFIYCSNGHFKLGRLFSSWKFWKIFSYHVFHYIFPPFFSMCSFWKYYLHAEPARSILEFNYSFYLCFLLLTTFSVVSLGLSYNFSIHFLFISDFII